MTDFGAALIVVFIYRIVVLLSGVAFAVMGYSLFVRGIYGEPADFSASRGGFKIVLRKAAPGVLFAAFGMAIVGQSTWRGIDIQRVRESLQTPTHNAVSPVPPKGVVTDSTGIRQRATKALKPQTRDVV